MASTPRRRTSSGERRPASAPAPSTAPGFGKEAIGKCTGAGLTAEASDDGVSVTEIEVGEGWAAAIAFAGPESPPITRYDA